MNRERRGWLALASSYILGFLNLFGFWIAGVLCCITYPLAFIDLYSVYGVDE